MTTSVGGERKKIDRLCGNFINDTYLLLTRKVEEGGGEQAI